MRVSRESSWIYQIPNTLTLLRIPLGFSLPFIAHRPKLFLVILAAAVVTDIADGRIARHLGVAGGFGVQLDSFADLVLYLGGLTAAIVAVPPEERFLPLTIVVVVMLIRIAAGVITHIRFGMWASVHTIANRIAGGMAGAGMIWFVWTTSVSVSLLVIIAIVCTLASLEELWIVANCERFDGDDPGVLAETFVQFRGYRSG